MAFGLKGFSASSPGRMCIRGMKFARCCVLMGLVRDSLVSWFMMDGGQLAFFDD